MSHQCSSVHNWDTNRNLDRLGETHATHKIWHFTLRLLVCLGVGIKLVSFARRGVSFTLQMSILVG